MKRCACPACTEPGDPLLDGLCGACFALCPETRAAGKFGMLGPAALGILAWRIHVLRYGLEGEGYDPVVWLPRVLAHGTLARAERAQAEHSRLADLFALRCGAED